MVLQKYKNTQSIRDCYYLFPLILYKIQLITIHAYSKNV